MKITIFNGGRGASSIINNLLSKKDIEITSIVNAYDDGKSTGEIRKYFMLDITIIQYISTNSTLDNLY